MIDSDHEIVSVCLVTRNRRDLLMNALKSLESQTHPVSEVIVVDNASTDGSVSAMKGDFPDVRIIRLHENKGCPPARNIAMVNATSDFIANLDDDGIFSSEAIEMALGVFRKFPRTGIVMMDIVENEKSRSPNVSDGQLLPVFSAGCSIIRSSVLEECGYFDDHIFRQGEEYDLSIRVFQVGWEIRFSKDAKMFHFPPKVLKNNPRIQYLGALSKSLALVKFAPLKFLVPDLTKRILGYSILFLKRGRVDLMGKLFFNFFLLLPRALRSRTVLTKGYETSRKLHKSYVR